YRTSPLLPSFPTRRSSDLFPISSKKSSGTVASTQWSLIESRYFVSSRSSSCFRNLTSPSVNSFDTFNRSSGYNSFNTFSFSVIMSPPHFMLIFQSCLKILLIHFFFFSFFIHHFLNFHSVRLRR